MDPYLAQQHLVDFYDEKEIYVTARRPVGEPLSPNDTMRRMTRYIIAPGRHLAREDLITNPGDQL